jgi:hypothetical protein
VIKANCNALFLSYAILIISQVMAAKVTKETIFLPNKIKHQKSVTRGFRE